MTPEIQERLEIIRRIAETGKRTALSTPPENTYVDLFQHILDELERIKI